MTADILLNMVLYTKVSVTIITLLTLLKASVDKQLQDFYAVTLLILIRPICRLYNILFLGSYVSWDNRESGHDY